MTIYGSMSDKRFHSDSFLALMLWKLMIMTRSFLLSTFCLVVLFGAVGDDVCWGGPTVSGSKSRTWKYVIGVTGCCNYQHPYCQVRCPRKGSYRNFEVRTDSSSNWHQSSQELHKCRCSCLDISCGTTIRSYYMLWSVPLWTTYMLYRISGMGTLVAGVLGLGDSHLHLTVQGQKDTEQVEFRNTFWLTFRTAVFLRCQLGMEICWDIYENVFLAV